MSGRSAKAWSSALIVATSSAVASLDATTASLIAAKVSDEICLTSPLRPWGWAIDEFDIHEAGRFKQADQPAAYERVGAAQLRRCGIEFAVAVESRTMRIAEVPAEIDVLDDEKAAGGERVHGAREQVFRFGEMREHEPHIDEGSASGRPGINHVAMVEFDIAELASAGFRAG